MTASRKRALLGLAALVILLLAVAVASTGSVPAGSSGPRRLSTQFADALISLFLLLMVAGVGLWAYILLIRKDAVAEALANRDRRRPWVSFASFAVMAILLAGFVRWVSVDEGLRQRIRSIGQRSAAARSGKGSLGQNGDYEPKFATGPVLVVLVVLGIVLVAFYLSYRARRRRLEPPAGSLLPTLGDVLDETLDDLRAEADPRRAVIAAYARMERALAAYGLPRDAAEAPDEYLKRILVDLDVSRRATSRLTALFSWAKFSSHDVAPEMKQEAIEALEAVREELRAAEILAEHQRALALAELRERADTR